MVFKKGDSETARKGGLQRVANERKGVEKLLTFLKEGGSERVEELYKRMLDDQELTKGELEFLRHYKDLMEYHTPKLSRAILTGENGTALFPLEQAQKIIQKNQ